MDSDQGKLFIGGISWETTEEKLNEYFGQYGEVSRAIVMRDRATGNPRGFAFVVFSDPNTVDRALQDSHTIDGRTVEAKRAFSREDQQNSAKSGNFNSAKNMNSGGTFRTKKIFVGGLPPTLTEEVFRQYFETYGYVTDITVMYDQNTQRPRGFGFVTFDSEEAVDRVLHKTFHDLDGKQVEVKRAMPKDANPGGGSRSMGSGPGAGGYQGYGASGGNPNAYAGMQPRNAGGYPSYGSSGYSAPGYGYGPANSGMGYGGYGNYGGGSTAYGAQAGAAFGNPSIPNSNYASGAPGAPKNSWSSQNPSAYGSMGYVNSASWGGPQSGEGGNGRGSSPAVHSPGGVAGYGIPSNGYGGFGGHPGGAPNSGGGGGYFPGSGGGYMGSSYGEVNEQPGYGNEAWNSDLSLAAGNYGAAQANGHGGQVNYGSGYGAQAREMEQQ